MKTFKIYLEDNTKQKIDSNPIFKIKDNYTQEINTFLEKVQQDQNLEDLKDIILNFKSNLESSNQLLNNVISNQDVKREYLKYYKQLLGKLEVFTNPPKDYENMVKDIVKQVNRLLAFIQSKVNL